MSGCLGSVTSQGNTEGKSQIKLFKKENPHLILFKVQNGWILLLKSFQTQF